MPPKNSRNIKDTSRSKAALATKSVQSMGMDDFDIDTIIDEVHECIGKMELDQAEDLINSAIQMASDPEDQAALFDLWGEVYTYRGDSEKAIEYYKKAEAAEPNASYERLFSLGQHTNDYESLNYYKSGLELLHQEIIALGPKKKGEDHDVAARRAEINEIASTVMCSIAELYVTDLCDDEAAEKECENFLQEAVKASPTNWEAFRSLANLRTIQGNKSQASKYAVQSLKLLNTIIEQNRDIPDFFARVELARLLFELENWKEASTLYTALLGENTQYIELWYQCGVAFYHLAKIEPESKTEHENASAQLLLTAQSLLAQDPDEELQTSIENQLRLLSEAGVNLDIARLALDESRPFEGEDKMISDDDLSDDDDTMM